MQTARIWINILVRWGDGQTATWEHGEAYFKSAEDVFAFSPLEKADFSDWKHITFCGGIDTQHILPEGTEEEVRLEVQRVLSIMAENGRYIFAGSQGLLEDIPVTNIIAMFDEGKRGV